MAMPLLCCPFVEATSMDEAGESIALVCVAARPRLTFYPHYTAPIAGLAADDRHTSCDRSGVGGPARKDSSRSLSSPGNSRGGAVDARWRHAATNWNQTGQRGSMSWSRGRYLIFVRPGGNYYPHNEWVDNAADIDVLPVIVRRHGRRREPKANRLLPPRRDPDACRCCRFRGIGSHHTPTTHSKS